MQISVPKGVRVKLEEATLYLDFLSWPAQVVNALRQLLATINIQLPALLAQLLVCIILLLISIYLRKNAATATSAAHKLGAYSVFAACLVGMISIVAVWIDYQLWPRNKEIFGQIRFQTDMAPQLELLDSFGDSLAAESQLDALGVFTLRFTPVFADPPATIRMSQQGCKNIDYNVRRTDLFGEFVELNWRCEKHV
jgi:hypothetical protein